MEFTLDEAHSAVAGLAADVLDRSTEPDATWKAMAQAGLLGLAIPEAVGGAGLGVLATALVLHAVGTKAAELPALPTLALGVLPVAALGTPAQQENLLPSVLDGSHLLTAATSEPGRALPAAPATTAEPTAAGFSLGGTKTGVAYAETAHRILVPASLTSGGAGVFLVDPTAPGVALDRVPTAATTPEYRLRLTDVSVPADALLGASTDGSAVTELNSFALAGACALGDGLLAGALALTARHLGERQQFGRPLAAFQAVAQQIADVYIAARTVHLASLAACWRMDTDRPAAQDLDVAGYWLAAELLPAMHTCHHLHGGLGVDITYPMHRYYTQARDLTRFIGGTQARLGRLGAVACSSN